MARGVNKVILIGNLGNDPDVRATRIGNSIATFSVATSEHWKDRHSGEPKEKTEWHRVVIFGKLAEIAQQYLHKGSKVYLEGKLQTRKWQSDDGIDRYSTEVVIDGFSGQLQMLDARRDNRPPHPATVEQPAIPASDTTKPEPEVRPEDLSAEQAVSTRESTPSEAPENTASEVETASTDPERA